ncbi:2'-5' RNA ligase family protein [candidate division WOR-3 bacterium]|nr:2'-5' RNA ligase family protein [candidate division WOR-3 bacterium]
MKIPTPGDSSLGIFPPDEVSIKIDKWRRVFDPNHKIISPHITLAFPFIPENDWPQMRPELIDCLKSFQPFDITLMELGDFAGNPLVLWLKPDNGGYLICIRAALEEQFPIYVPASEFGYVPHLTVGFFDSNEALSRVKNTILSELEPLQFCVDSVNYMVFGDNGKWCLRDKIYL